MADQNERQTRRSFFAVLGTSLMTPSAIAAFIYSKGSGETLVPAKSVQPDDKSLGASSDQGMMTWRYDSLGNRTTFARDYSGITTFSYDQIGRRILSIG